MVFEGVREDVWQKGGGCAVKIGGAHADPNQRKHVQASIEERAPSSNKENAATPEHDYSCEDELNPSVDRDRHEVICAQTGKHLPEREEKYGGG